MPAGERLLRPYFGMHRFEWPDDDSVEFHLPHGELIALLSRCGLELEEMIEVRAPDSEAVTRWPLATREWARKWPPKRSGRPAGAAELTSSSCAATSGPSTTSSRRPATRRCRAAALQYVRKISGANKPSKANAEAFERAVDEVTAASTDLLATLVTAAPPRNRQVEAEKARGPARRSASPHTLAARPAAGLGSPDDRLLAHVATRRPPLTLVAATGCGGDTKENNDYVDAVNKAQTDFVAERHQGPVHGLGCPGPRCVQPAEHGHRQGDRGPQGRGPARDVKALHDQLISQMGNSTGDRGSGHALKSGDPAQIQQAQITLGTEVAQIGTKVSSIITDINKELQN